MVDLLKGVGIVSFTHFLLGPMGLLDKLGLSCEVLKKENPELIYAADTGCGPNGPYVNRPAGPEQSS
jgi:hypothetical protein